MGESMGGRLHPTQVLDERRIGTKHVCLAVVGEAKYGRHYHSADG